MEIITDVLTGLRTVDSSLEKEDTEKEEDKQEKSSKKANKVEVATKIAQIVLEVAAGERTPNGFVRIPNIGLMLIGLSLKGSRVVLSISKGITLTISLLGEDEEYAQA